MTTTSLTAPQADLVRETEPARLAELTEDELIELHQRVRRARNKHVGLYRRQASARVPAKGARGAARPANRLNADRAEVFELALARVSARLGVVARAAATELKAERLAAAREVKAGTGPGSVASFVGSASVPSVPSARRRATKTTGGLKRDASSQSQGARRQARADAR
ncbi:hypothetical protein GCM10009868_35270 [Terrabacter aerolatus]|uniref:Uncharacterized protein n=1 Tax=Terrabacter aerolatus TaxID=422442 RepID=A0A512CW87_9MICO|nr:hypothetical protein [Terrabacter aerolatus]GEO28488.1 hypothetical protein TAE01_02980 [Terrabacter aerolatus]